MTFFNKLKTDALSVWDALEGKLSKVESPLLRLAMVAGAAVVAMWILTSIIPTIFAILFTIGLVLIFFKMFSEDWPPE